jgi:biopolymer transport protein TolQ
MVKTRLLEGSPTMRPVIFANLVTLGASGASGKTLDPWELILNASPVVMFVLCVLAGMSLVCWFIIGAKLVRLSQAARQSESFLDQFWDPQLGNVWSVQRMERLYAGLPRDRRSPVASVFHAGYVELARVLGGSDESARSQRHYGGDIENVARALRRAQANEVTTLESMVPFLATTGSTAPFVGLFGTVWGIMNSFIHIGAQKNASLDVVAPGIAEALIATAIGLVAAIPAVMAYNYFLRRINVLSSEMENFSSDYLNIVRRHFLAS